MRRRISFFVLFAASFLFVSCESPFNKKSAQSTEEVSSIESEKTPPACEKSNGAAPEKNKHCEKPTSTTQIPTPVATTGTSTSGTDASTVGASTSSVESSLTSGTDLIPTPSSTPSVEASASPTPTAPADLTGPSSVTGLSLGSSPSSLSFTPPIYWTSATDEDGGSGVNAHQVMVESVQGSVTLVGWQTQDSGSVMTLAGLLDGVSYRLSVRAQDHAGNLGSIASITYTPNLKTLTYVDGGLDFFCGLTQSGGVKCWGNVPNFGLYQVPTLIPGLESQVTRLSLGNYAVCLVQSGKGKCFGHSIFGHAYGSSATSLQEIPGLSSGGVTEIAAPWGTGLGAVGCAIDAGVVKCWGGNSFGCVGDGTTTQRTEAVTISGIYGGVPTIVTTGGSMACAIAGGRRYCWGYNSDTSPSLLGLNCNCSSLKGPSDGYYTTEGYTFLHHKCGIASDGTARCWGGFAGTSSINITPSVITSLENDTSVIVADSNSFACAIKAGVVKCMAGTNIYGQAGNGLMNSNPTDWHSVTGLTGNFIGIGGTKNASACALRDDGKVFCWGLNSSYQLGDRTTSPRSTPVEVQF
jgi:hypothetical protein